MKIINRKEFLKLPAGVIYSKFEPCIFGDIRIKGDTSYNDWYYQDLLMIDANDSGEWSEIVHSAMNEGENIPLNLHYEGRDGYYDEDQLFAVFENKDAIQLVHRLIETLSNYPEI